MYPGGRALASESAGVNLWLNCDGPLRLHTLHGHVVLLEWSSGRSNCIRTLAFRPRQSLAEDVLDGLIRPLGASPKHFYDAGAALQA